MAMHFPPRNVQCIQCLRYTSPLAVVAQNGGARWIHGPLCAGCRQDWVMYLLEEARREANQPRILLP